MLMLGRVGGDIEEMMLSRKWEVGKGHVKERGSEEKRLGSVDTRFSPRRS